MRQKIALANMEAARQFLAGDGTVAILDATNASRRRRRLIQATLTDYPVLFIDCVNEDPVLREACIMRKTELPEYRGYTTQAARDSFVARIHYYESIYSHVGEDEKYWLLVDTMANRIVGESALESSPYYPAIREVVVCTWVKNLYLIRHGKPSTTRKAVSEAIPCSWKRGVSRQRPWPGPWKAGLSNISLRQRAADLWKRPLI